MSPRVTQAFSWLAVITLTVVLQLVVSCGGDRGPSENGTADAAISGAEGEPTSIASATAADLDQPEMVVAPPPEGRPELLSDWAQLNIIDGQLQLADGVLAYTLRSPLFSDYAHKLRTVSLPDGAGPVVYDSENVFDFPVGTVITKTFYFPVAEGGPDAGDQVLKQTPDPESLLAPLDLATVRLIETRVLVRREDGWHALPYVWNDDQTEATLMRTGDLIGLTLVDEPAEAAAGTEAAEPTSFIYVVPDVNQCSSCHAENHSSGAMEPIGPKARHLNTQVNLGDGLVSQLDHWQMIGLLASAPPIADIPTSVAWDDGAAPLDDRARTYLDINCAHCHNRAGTADTSGLFLEPWTELGSSLGVCKLPIAAGTGTGGRAVGIHPGEPDQSIFVYRMQTQDPGAMMPEVGRSLTHTEGVELISAWIESLSGTC